MRSLILAAVASAALLATSCGDRRAAVEPLRVAVPGSAAASLVHLAAARGFFGNENVSVTLVPATHGRAAVEEMAAGRADFALAAEVVFALAVARGDDVVMTTAVSSARRDSVIVARRDRGIAAPADLAGRKVGLTPGTSADYFLWAFLTWNKVAPDAVTVVPLPPADIPAALADGRVDAVSTWHPIVLRAQEALGANAATFVEEDAYTQTFVVMGRSAVARRHSQAMQRFLRALIRAEDFARLEPEQAMRMTAERIGIDHAALRPIWRDLRFRVELPQSQLMTLEDEARWAMAREHVGSRPMPDYLSRLHLEPLLAVDRTRVSVLN